jgi:acyl-CoA hydrolase
MLEESVICHLVRPEDLNHHGTLFAGQISKWLVEAGVIRASQLVGRPEDIVCVQLNQMTFKKPINNGDILEIKSRIAYLGKSSITIYNRVFVNKGETPLITSMATFVTVDKQNKPYKHGFELTEEYIAQNKEIYQEAIRLRNAK